ncbi:MAG TPA: hypothetical protein VE547_05520 [Mycobacteriales bacterium]|jgi:hypothetical protein|nr:hypothetical protein [Mycobacteriales bacterium]
MTADLERRLRELPARLDALHAPADLADRVRRRHRRGTRLRVVAAAAAAAAVLAGTAVAVGRPDPAPPAGPAPTASPGAPPHGPAPTDPQLLRWPTRGPLAADAAERDRVMRDLEAGAWADQDTGLRAPSRRPTHILWLGPAYPGPLPVPASRAALIQQWAGDRRLLAVLENPGDGYRLVTVAASELDPDRPLVALWSPGACRQPPAGRYCPHRWATVLLATPGTRRIALTSGPPADPFDPRNSGGWHPLPVVDGYAFITLTPAEVAPTLQVRFDGGVPVSLRYWMSPLGPADPDEPTPGAGPNPTDSRVDDWLPVRGLPPLLDVPETFPGLDLWGRLHGQPGRPGYGPPLWGGTLADGSRAVVIQPVVAYETPHHLAMAVTPPGGEVFLVRDLPVIGLPKAVAQVSAYLPLSDGRCQLVVVGKNGTTSIRYAEDGARYVDLPVRDGVATRVVDRCDGHGAARISVTRAGQETYAGMVDSTRPGGGVRR